MSTLRTAAMQVLAEATGPLSAEEITQRAQEQGILSSGSRTPAASVGAAIYMDIKRNPNSPFVQTGPNRFTLKPGALLDETAPKESVELDLDEEIAHHNQRVKERLLQALKEMHPKAFEHLIERLLERLGYEGVEVTPYSRDGGIDVKATLTVGGVTSVPTAVQVKRYEANVSGKVVRELRGGIGVHERGLIITTAGFTKDAVAEAASPNKVPISLVDGRKLVDLLVSRRIGVVVKSVEVFDLDLASLQVDEPEGSGGNGALYQSMWPLPGGDYLGALDAMLEYVAAESPAMEEMVAWIKARFPSVESDKVARSYTNLLRYAGLIALEGTQLVVTPYGSEYLSTGSQQFLLALFLRRFTGLAEMLELLRAAPGSLETLHGRLVERLGVQWSTTAQSKHRLEWLRALGAADRASDGTWFAAQP